MTDEAVRIEEVKKDPKKPTYEELEAQNAELTAQNTEVIKAYQNLVTMFNNLNEMYDDLKAKYIQKGVQTQPAQVQ